jgi:hypothetical protein
LARRTPAVLPILPAPPRAKNPGIRAFLKLNFTFAMQTDQKIPLPRKKYIRVEILKGGIPPTYYPTPSPKMILIPPKENYYLICIYNNKY